MRSVGITGMGLMSILGMDTRAHQAVFEQSGGLRPDFDKDYWNGYFAGEAGRIPSFDPKRYIKNPKSIKFMGRQTILGCTSVSQAIQDAALTEEELQKDEYQNALIWGAGVSDSIMPLAPAVTACLYPDGSIDYQKLGTEGYRNLPPLWILEKLPNTTAGQISVQNSIRGLNYTVVNGPLNGMLSIARAFEQLAEQRTNRVICGAAEAYTHADYIYSLDGKGILSLTDRGLMPFGEDSDGCYIAEGAAAFVLEDEETASRRGAGIHARILSCHTRYLPRFTDGGVEYAASRFEQCMRAALDNAGLSVNQIDMIQANACGDPRQDLPEAIAISKLFGSKVPVTSCAPLAGYTLGASGAVSAAYAMLQMERNAVLPIGRTEKFHLQDELNYARDGLRQHEIRHVLINSFSYMGEACSIIMGRGDM